VKLQRLAVVTEIFPERMLVIVAFGTVILSGTWTGASLVATETESVTGVSSVDCVIGNMNDGGACGTGTGHNESQWWTL
jgi:hypothetical protein